MSQVKGTVLQSFRYKGKQYHPGDEITMSAHGAKVYSKIDHVELDKEAEHKVETAVEKQAAPKKGASKK